VEVGLRRRSCFVSGTRFLVPDIEGVRPDLAIGRGYQVMSAGREVAVNEGVGREEVLGVPRRFEPLHLALSSSRRSMRVLGPIIQIAALSVLDAGKQATLSDAVAAQGFRQNSRQRTLFRWRRPGYRRRGQEPGIDAMHWVRLDSRFGAERADRARLPPIRCRDCGKQFNERSESLLDRTQYASDVIGSWCSGGCATNSACATCQRCS
jgi:hypothetical protein